MSNNHGVWKTVRVTCGDGRLQRAMLEYAESLGGLSDPVPAPGGVKKLLVDKAYREKVLEDVATYLRLHHQDTILVLQHEDCGAYGGKQAFSDDFVEKEFHKQELAKAAALLQERLPDKRVVIGFMTLNGTVEVFQDFAAALV